MSNQIDQFVHALLPPPESMPDYFWGEHGFEEQETLNVVSALFERVKKNGFMDRPFLRSSKRVVTYAQAFDLVSQLSSFLTEELQLVSGNRVLLRGGNSISMALHWLAVVNCGLVAVSTMPLLRAKELGEVIQKSRPTVALCDQSLMQELKAAHDFVPCVSEIIGFDSNHLEGEAFIRASKFATNTWFCKTRPKDIALLAFTSGTTGLPKAAAHTHLDILGSCEAWPKHILKAAHTDIIMGSPPLAFTFGLGGLLIFPMYSGSSVFFPDAPYKPETMVQLMHEAKCTICYTAPTFYRQMAPFIQRNPVPSLRISVSAGEALADATRQLWKQASHLEMIDGIGSTELFHIFVSSPPQSVRAGAIGKVVPGYIAQVVDSQGIEVPNGEVGRLRVKGPTGCKYMGDPRQANYVQGGWNFPGDLFKQDNDGYLYYQSRDDDMIITAGYNVGAPEVEDALLKHPAVQECAVIGQKDEERGMLVKAFCVLRDGYSPGLELTKILQDHVKNLLAPYKYPREISYVDKLPRTETGKLQRFKLKEI